MEADNDEAVPLDEPDPECKLPELWRNDDGRAEDPDALTQEARVSSHVDSVELLPGQPPQFIKDCQVIPLKFLSRPIKRISVYEDAFLVDGQTQALKKGGNLPASESHTDSMCLQSIAIKAGGKQVVSYARRAAWPVGRPIQRGSRRGCRTPPGGRPPACLPPQVPAAAHPFAPSAAGCDPPMPPGRAALDRAREKRIHRPERASPAPIGAYPCQGG